MLFQLFVCRGMEIQCKQCNKSSDDISQTFFVNCKASQDTHEDYTVIILCIYLTSRYWSPMKTGNRFSTKGSSFTTFLPIIFLEKKKKALINIYIFWEFGKIKSGTRGQRAIFLSNFFFNISICTVNFIQIGKIDFHVFQKVVELIPTIFFSIKKTFTYVHILLIIFCFL